MTCNKTLRTTTSSLLIAGLLVVTACTSSLSDRSNLAAEPTALSDVNVEGGGTYEPLRTVENAELADVIVEARVVDVQKSYVNTKDGLFPTVDDLTKSGFTDLTVLTDVEMEVISTLGSTNDAFAYNPGSTITITVGGGVYRMALSASDANALGFTEVKNGPFPEHNEGDGLPPDEEIEGPVTEPLEFTWGTTTDIVLEEGETVTILLIQHEIDGYDTDLLTLLSPVHPGGVFRQTTDGVWVSDYAEETVDIHELVTIVTSE